jgi:hypothetical protein
LPVKLNNDDSLAQAPLPEPGAAVFDHHVVCIGASAGGLDALERFFATCPVDTGAAFVVVQHLSPDHKSMMNTLVSRHTQVPVIMVGSRELVHAEISHRHWVRDVENCILGNSECLPPMDAALCELGQWISGPASARYRNHCAFHVILTKHDNVHSHAQQLID